MCDSFLPSMRKLVTLKLSSQGFSQGRIASMLGVTQASVSLYLKSRARSMRSLESLGVSREDAELYASLLAEDLKKNPVYAVNTLYSIWSDILGRGAMCSAHRTRYPSLAQCDMCMKTFGAHARTKEGDAVEHVAEAVRMIEESSTFVRVMPEVSVNIAYAGEGASSVQDVVAVPGRIVKVRGMPRSFMRPEHGASTHVASILLTVMFHDPSLRAAMNLRYDEKMGQVLRALRLSSFMLEESPGHRTDDEMLAALREKLRFLTTPLDALVDPGGSGIEPGLYLFAGDAVKVAQLGLGVARSYVGEG
jgi:predicted fused transcriptional regulator/phosphomethylpyrimidine kinase/predicted transcriptional regulator